MAIRIKNLHKAFGDLIVLEDFSIRIEKNRITGILGPSGCGKTTLLNLIAGLIDYDDGEIEGLEDKTFSYIFQEDRLLPWSTVEENIKFVLETRYKGEEIQRITRDYLDMVGLNEYAHYYPSQLSGGMKQRVAVARAFAYPSDILLMDEPFKGLDLELKTGLIKSFIELWEQDKRTVIFVTHDLEEAMSFAHYIYILGGKPLSIKDRLVIAKKEK